MSKLAHSNQETMDKIDAQRALHDLSFQEAFGLIVRNRRHDKNWTQSDLAIRFGKSRASIANIELGRQATSLEGGLRLINILDMKIEDFIPQRDYMII